MTNIPPTMLTPYAPPVDWVQARINVTGTAAVELLPAAGAGLRNNLTTLIVANTGTIAQNVTIVGNTGTAAVVLAVLRSPAAGGSNPSQFAIPLRTAPNVNVGVVCDVAGSQDITAIGYKGV